MSRRRAVSLIQIGAGVEGIQGGASRIARPGVHTVSLRWIAGRTKPSSLRFFQGLAARLTSGPRRGHVLD